MATGIPRAPKKSDLFNTGDVQLNYPQKNDPKLFADATSRFLSLTAPPDDKVKRLYFGDNLSALQTLARDSQVRGKVRLVYIDPPFGTQTIFYSRKLAPAYEDRFHLGEYLEFMRQRLILLHEILASDGSVYLHLDDKMLFHVKLIMDEIFGSRNYRNLIARKKCNPKNYTRKTFGNVADYILFYSKSEDYIWNRPVEPWTPERSKEYQYKESDTGRRYMRVPVHAPGSRNGATGMEWRGKLPPPGKHWQFTPEALDEMDRRGEIVWSKNGNPRRKVYLDQSSGIPVQDVWMDFKDAHNQNIHVTGYPTEKNLDMLKRIVAASSNPNDLVMDCFCGSGTTLMAAESLGRQWIGADRSPEAIRTILTRFSKGTSPMGDFVDKDDGTPSLFETEPLQVNSTHKGITEFEFLAEETDRDAAYALIKDAGFSYTEIDAAEVRVA